MILFSRVVKMMIRSLLKIVFVGGLTTVSSVSSANSPKMIDIYEKVEIGGIPQQIWIRGNDSTKPLLLFLHGGPGHPHMHQAAAETNLLVNDYIVVQWDQRGAGASSSESTDPKSLTILQMQQDTRELIIHLLNRFQQSKLFLLGHSWGGYLGLRVAHAYPELLHAFVAIGPAVGGPKMMLSLRDKMLARAKIEGRSSEWEGDAMKALKNLSLKYIMADPVLFFDRWNEGFLRHRQTLGGSSDVDEFRMSKYLALPENETPQLSTTEAREQYISQVSLGQERNRLLFHEVISKDIAKTVKELRVPLFAFLGRHDTNVDSDLAEQYFRKLRAPFKRVVWFENSAHMMTFEEPAFFQYLMTKVVPTVRD